MPYWTERDVSLSVAPSAYNVAALRLAQQLDIAHVFVYTCWCNLCTNHDHMVVSGADVAPTTII